MYNLKFNVVALFISALLSLVLLGLVLYPAIKAVNTITAVEQSYIDQIDFDTTE